MQIQSYSKGELSQMYAPNLTPQSALNRLNEWLKKNTQLMEALTATGYYKTQRVFTTKQVRLIFEYLGEP